MTQTFRIDNLSDIKDAYTFTGCSAFFYYLNDEYNLPMYFYTVNGVVSGHQDINDDGTWYSRQAEEDFHNALPYETFRYPEKYPEYYI